ncbi:snRNA-activating protein complex subunit 3 [Nymphon striatum]|nr:snRNA-activating protein complex subunit 3 [Nymphon striatum]
MINIHKPEYRPYISEKINVRNFIQEWLDVLEQTEGEDIGDVSNKPKENSIENIAQSMSQPVDVVQSISELCSIDNLTSENELTMSRPCKYEIPPGVDLLSIKERKTRLDQLKHSSGGWCKTLVKNGLALQGVLDAKYSLISNFKMFSLDKESINHVYLAKLPNRIKDDTIKNKIFKYYNLHNNFSDDIIIEDKIDGPDVVLDVQIFRPVSDKWKKDLSLLNVEIHLDQELRVLGRQPLTMLRDKIHCPIDYSIPEEVSENPFHHNFALNKTLYKSGFFFIDDTFYNDFRDSQNIDYSKVISDWAKEKEDIGSFEKAEMETTCFGQLTIQLGYPYLYQHQGSCEHLIIFSDIRWITTGDERLPETPFFFCDACFNSFNYNTEGNKLTDFKAYHYFDRSALP